MKPVAVIVEEIEVNRKAQEALKAEKAEEAKSEFEVHTAKPIPPLEEHSVEPVIPIKKPVKKPVIEKPVKAEEPVKTEAEDEADYLDQKL